MWVCVCVYVCACTCVPTVSRRKFLLLAVVVESCWADGIRSSTRRSSCPSIHNSTTRARVSRQAQKTKKGSLASFLGSLWSASHSEAHQPREWTSGGKITVRTELESSHTFKSTWISGVMWTTRGQVQRTEVWEVLMVALRFFNVIIFGMSCQLLIIDFWTRRGSYLGHGL